jgi:hypothetical protein
VSGTQRACRARAQHARGSAHSAAVRRYPSPAMAGEGRKHSASSTWRACLARMRLAVGSAYGAAERRCSTLRGSLGLWKNSSGSGAQEAHNVPDSHERDAHAAAHVVRPRCAARPQRRLGGTASCANAMRMQRRAWRGRAALPAPSCSWRGGGGRGKGEARAAPNVPVLRYSDRRRRHTWCGHAALPTPTGYPH